MNATLQSSTGTTSERRLAVPPEIVAAVAAPICALVAWLLLVVVGGVELSVLMNGAVTAVGWAAVAITAAGAGLVGLLALRVLRRLTTHALVVWTALAALVLAGSMLGPLSATSLGALWTLVTLHSVVAAVVLAIGWRAPAGRR